jgi:hypothetical protein
MPAGEEEGQPAFSGTAGLQTGVVRKERKLSCGFAGRKPALSEKTPA